MWTIAVIGVGAIGRRHLQSLLYSTLPLSIFIQDRSEGTLSAAIEFASELISTSTSTITKEVNPVNKISNLPNHLDVCIISTCADNRCDVLLDLLVTTNVKALILEKFLFQKIEDYSTVGKALAKTKTPTWVNCPMRLMQPYSRFPTLVNKDMPVKIKVSGYNWGLGCNSIHFIDFLQFVTDSPASAVKMALSKHMEKTLGRGDFLEFFGEVIVHNNRGDELQLICMKDSLQLEKRFTIQISNKPNTFLITFDSTGITFDDNYPNSQSVSHYHETYQSELTHLIVENILSSGHCQLPQFGPSASDHLLLVKAFITYLNREHGYNTDICPIT